MVLNIHAVNCVVAATGPYLSLYVICFVAKNMILFKDKKERFAIFTVGKKEKIMSES